MRLHQLRVAALFGTMTRRPFNTDCNAIEAWTIWIERTDAQELAAFVADVESAQARYDALAEERRYYASLENEHANAYRETYYKRSNLL